MQVHIIKEIIKNKDEKALLDNPNLQQDKKQGKQLF